MATEHLTCVLYPSTFMDNNEFWRHMEAGTRGKDSANAVLPPSMPNVNQVDLHSVVSPLPLSVQSSSFRPEQPQPINSNMSEYDFTAKSSNVPFFDSQPATSQLLSSSISTSLSSNPSPVSNQRQLPIASQQQQQPQVNPILAKQNESCFSLR